MSVHPADFLRAAYVAVTQAEAERNPAERDRLIGLARACSERAQEIVERLGGGSGE